MKITKEMREEFSKRRRKLFRKNDHPYENQMMITLDKEYAALKQRVGNIQLTVNIGSYFIMQDLETEYYANVGISDFSEKSKIQYELSSLAQQIVEHKSLQEDYQRLVFLSEKPNLSKKEIESLKGEIVLLEAKLAQPIHFYNVLEEKTEECYQNVMTK